MGSGGSTLPPKAVKEASQEAAAWNARQPEEAARDAAACKARRPEEPHAPCGPAWQEGFVCNTSDTSKSVQAAVPKSCLPAQANSTQNGGDAPRVAQLDPFHGQSEKMPCTDASPSRLSKSDSWLRSSLIEGGTDISHVAADCFSPGLMPVWLRERVVRKGDANPVMEFQREERPGQRTLIVARSLDGEVAAQIEEPGFDDELLEASDSAEPEIESSPSGLATAQFLSENIRPRQAGHTRAEASDHVA
eukprot:TRINITY_DN7234_c1_g1_i15.p1 TRINITY_DN7234_c1_g1~~TRINITY_DN7234_c1_g1_i15.p1  ORF type:complete len:248 (-),score=46.18 TRINITY_DN7234_c1_g1_i15:468-1211(-)